MWVTMDDSDPKYKAMYANHKQMVETVIGLRVGFGCGLTVSIRMSGCAGRSYPYPYHLPLPLPYPDPDPYPYPYSYPYPYPSSGA